MKNHNFQPATRRAIAAHNPLPFLRLPTSRARNHHPLPLNVARNFPSSHPHDSSLLLLRIASRRIASRRLVSLFLVHPHRIYSHQAHTYITVVFPMYSSSRAARSFSIQTSWGRVVECRPRDAVVVVLPSPSKKFISLPLYISRTFRCSLNFPTLPPFHLAGHLRQTL